MTTSDAAATWWPLFGLVVRTPRLELRYPTDSDVVALAELAARGVHDPGSMPFAVSWTDAPTDGTQQRNTMQHFWKARADWTESSWTLNLATIIDGEPVGSQGLLAHDFARLRSAETGSWLGQAHQQQGIGKEMRAAILHLAFAGLGADRVTSGAYHDNLGSQGVSRSLGYEDNGVHWQLRRGQPDRIIRFLLTRERWRTLQRDDIQIIGLEPCLAMFGLPANATGAGGPNVLGADGCRGGWVVCDSELHITVVPDAHELLALLDSTVSLIGVDIPIGIPHLGERVCDRELRSWLRTKASSIFSPAPRLVQGCASHAEAVAMLRQHDQNGISIQAWGINPKILEIDQALPRGRPENVIEVHPEASFAAMNDNVPVLTKKRSADGRAERLGVLRRHFGDAVDKLPTRLPGAAPDDILDAVAAMWSARRAALGTAKKFGSGELDPLGRPMFIHV